ncbi:hypothetical protein GOBAR_DD16656 [Gossypium barbadense]|nr:hypothetical protein GOBAR_DD16656 [Gossypium barbadense]
MSLHLLRPKILYFFTAIGSSRLLSSKSCNFTNKLIFSKQPFSSFFFSTTSTPYPLQYDMIINTPTQSQPTPTRRRLSKPDSPNSPEEEDPEKELGFDSWVQKKLTSEEEMDKSKRKYYKKRRKRMYGSDSEDDDKGKNEDGFVELKPKVVEFDRLHEREEELYFYDTFAYPWENDKHYKMEEENSGEDVKEKVTEKKVEEFFKCLKKVPNKETDDGEPYLVGRSTGLPTRWDGPYGTVVLVNKPKGWTSFTVCGKLRRLVKVKKVGHAGTLDPMATGLLIVCVGKATKLVERYQGMVKGYSGVFRLGEATSTWDADSPVIQREPWEHIKDEDIKKAAASFCGEIWQVPPMFSAIKVGGERMYEKARKGETVELSPRRISIFHFDIERSLEDRQLDFPSDMFKRNIYPIIMCRFWEGFGQQNLIFRVTCSKGTYIRSLCADFGKALGSCAHLTALRRDSIGEYSAEDAWEFKELEEAITKGCHQCLSELKPQSTPSPFVHTATFGMN